MHRRLAERGLLPTHELLRTTVPRHQSEHQQADESSGRSSTIVVPGHVLRHPRDEPHSSRVARMENSVGETHRSYSRHQPHPPVHLLRKGVLYPRRTHFPFSRHRRDRTICGLLDTRWERSYLRNPHKEETHHLPFKSALSVGSS